MTKLIEITDYKENHLNTISEDRAQEIISNKGSILMIFEKADGSKYGYITTQFTDLGHAKKVTINRFLQFQKIPNI